MPNPFHQPITYLAETVGRSEPKPFGIYQPDRLFHTFILGQTGTGKSTLILNMIRQDIEQGVGFCLIDPHGDLAEAVKPMLPENAMYWDVADPDCPYGYNPLGYVTEEFRPLVASAVIDALRQQWRDAWGVRMEHLLRFSVLALISRSGSSFADIVPIFTNKAFRRTVLQSVTNEEVLKFWQEEFPKLNYKTAFDGVAPIANKLGAFLSNPVVKKVLCSPNQNLRFRSLMDEGTPLVVNLSKGKLGSDISSVLGGLILSMMTSAAFTRSDTPEL
ncbi:type IV secretory system conjugative DNA transfer family protein [Planktotalea sp.]|uniref:type IV secretory system conjugative DNA transfer family protein n=1 Tax=Planktotalea sp. TaxID=2029877 RepID=UPI003D6A4713